jgi:hypothetical protein
MGNLVEAVSGTGIVGFGDEEDVHVIIHVVDTIDEVCRPVS